jgi:D-serine deaminase-like pyridoxal phosphate-dependent protein
MTEKLRKEEIKTPALLLDMDRMQVNLQTMSEYFRLRKAKLRPHFKGHLVLAFADKQIEAGAIGMTCARLEQAERLVQHGITNVLVASEIAGTGMMRQFVELSEQAPVMVAVDNPQMVCDLAVLAGSHAAKINLVVDLDVGLGRCGVTSPEAALSLTKLILQKGMRFRGLMGYGGSNRLPHGPEKERAARTMLQPLLYTKSLMESAGIAVEIVSCGCTADYAVMAAVPEVTEIQTGSYLLMDTGHNPFAPEFHRTLSVLATVVSKTGDERIVIDAGLKALGLNPELPEVKGAKALRVKALHAEHAIVKIIDPSVPIQIGDKIEIWVQYLDSALALHSRMYGMKGQQVEKTFKIDH